MSYELFIGDRRFSSWSMRGWLMLENFGLPSKTTLVGLYTGTMAADLKDLAPARTVPAMRCADGAILTDSLAMAETLVERHPDLPLYPADPVARALARSLVAEMHSSFQALRNACPNSIGHAWSGFAPSDEVMADLARIQELWAFARARYGDGGPWLFGAYSLADVFYAPVACRMATYQLPVSGAARAYVALHLADPAFRRWRAMGQTKTYDPLPYDMNLPKADWPGPTPIAARAVDRGPSVNAACPYSGKPVTHFLECGGKVYGFCNAFCRDKTLADPAAWPQFMALLD